LLLVEVLLKVGQPGEVPLLLAGPVVVQTAKEGETPKELTVKIFTTSFEFKSEL